MRRMMVLLLGVMGLAVVVKGALPASVVMIGKPVQRFEARGGGVSMVAITKDGGKVAAANVDGTVWLWDASTGKEIWHVKPGGFMGLSVVFSEDGKKMLAGDGGGVTRELETDNGNVLMTFGKEEDGPVQKAFYFDHEKSVVTTGNSGVVRTWEEATGKLVKEMEGNEDGAAQMVVSPDGTWAATGSPSEKTLEVWDLGTGKVMNTFTAGGTVPAVAVSPDGKRLYCAISTRVIRVRNPLTGKTIKVLKNPVDLDVTSMNVSPDGKYLMISNYVNRVRIIDAETGEILAQLNGHKEVVWSVLFSSDGKYAVTGGGGSGNPKNGGVTLAKDDVVRLWDLGEWLGKREAATQKGLP